nr:MAG TPA: hypothetical protein [Caudoviricetes sp.]
MSAVFDWIIDIIHASNYVKFFGMEKILQKLKLILKTSCGMGFLMINYLKEIHLSQWHLRPQA